MNGAAAAPPTAPSGSTRSTSRSSFTTSSAPDAWRSARWRAAAGCDGRTLLCWKVPGQFDAAFVPISPGTPGRVPDFHLTLTYLISEPDLEARHHMLGARIAWEERS